VREEVASEYSGLIKLDTRARKLLAGDAAILAEPTGARIRGRLPRNVRVGITLMGERAHTARRGWGANAIHRLGHGAGEGGGI